MMVSYCGYDVISSRVGGGINLRVRPRIKLEMR